MSRQHTLSRLHRAETLLIEARERLRASLRCFVECACKLRLVDGHFVPKLEGMDAETYAGLREDIAMIRQVDAYLGPMPDLGPDWLDAFIASYPAEESQS